MIRWWKNHVDTDYLVIGGLVGGGVFVLLGLFLAVVFVTTPDAPALWWAPVIAAHFAFLVFLASALVALGNAIWDWYKRRPHTTFER